MGNRQTNYTRIYREKIRRDALVYREIKELAIDHPDLGPVIREAERRVDAERGTRQAS
jgi:hypothetical protein